MAKDKETATRAEEVQKERQARITKLIKTLEAGADKDDQKFRRVEKLDKERLKLAKKEEKFEDLGQKLWQSTFGGLFKGMTGVVPEPVKILGRMVGVAFGAKGRIKKKKKKLLAKAYKRAAKIGLDTAGWEEKTPESLEEIVENAELLHEIKMPEEPKATGAAYKPMDWLLGKGPQGGGVGKENKTIEKKGAESFVLTHDVKLYELMEKWYTVWDRIQLTPAQRREQEIESRKKKGLAVSAPTDAGKKDGKDGWFSNLFGVGGLKGLIGRMLPMIGLGGLLGGGMLAGLGAIAIPAAIILWGIMSAVKVLKDWKEGFKEGGFTGAIAQALGGSEKGGWMSALKGAGKWGGIGAMAGFAVTLGNPIGALVGALIGIAIGGVLGWLGSDKIKATLDKVSAWFDLDDAMTEEDKIAQQAKMDAAKARIAAISKPGGEMDQLDELILRYEEMKGEGIKLTDTQTADYERALEARRDLNTELIEMHDRVAELELKFTKQEYKEAQDKRQELESKYKDIVGGKLVWSWAAMDWIRMYGSLKDTRIKIDKLKEDLVVAQQAGDEKNIEFITKRIAALEKDIEYQEAEAERLAKELADARDKEFKELQELYRAGDANFIQRIKYRYQYSMKWMKQAGENFMDRVWNPFFDWLGELPRKIGNWIFTPKGTHPDHPSPAILFGVTLQWPNWMKTAGDVLLDGWNSLLGWAKEVPEKISNWFWDKDGKMFGGRFDPNFVITIPEFSMPDLSAMLENMKQKFTGGLAEMLSNIPKMFLSADAEAWIEANRDPAKAAKARLQEAIDLGAQLGPDSDLTKDLAQQETLRKTRLEAGVDSGEKSEKQISLENERQAKIDRLMELQGSYESDRIMIQGGGTTGGGSAAQATGETRQIPTMEVWDAKKQGVALTDPRVVGSFKRREIERLKAKGDEMTSDEERQVRVLESQIGYETADAGGGSGKSATHGEQRMTGDLVTLETPSGLQVQVAKKFAPNFAGLLGALGSLGYDVRNIVGYRQTGSGIHPWGAAIDVNRRKNKYQNPLVSDMPGVWKEAPQGGVELTLATTDEQKQKLHPDGKFGTLMPQFVDGKPAAGTITGLAAHYGLGWGGNFSQPDAMHFNAMGGQGKGYLKGLSTASKAHSGGDVPLVKFKDVVAGSISSGGFQIGSKMATSQTAAAPVAKTTNGAASSVATNGADSKSLPGSMASALSTNYQMSDFAYKPSLAIKPNLQGMNFNTWAAPVPPPPALNIINSGNSSSSAVSTNNQLNQEPGWALHHVPVYQRGRYMMGPT